MLTDFGAEMVKSLATRALGALRWKSGKPSLGCSFLASERNVSRSTVPVTPNLSAALPCHVPARSISEI